MHSIDKKSTVDAITSNDLILRKLEGITNKIDIVSVTDEDKQLSIVIYQILTLHREIAEGLTTTAES
jgi:hypothetical protein